MCKGTQSSKIKKDTKLIKDTDAARYDYDPERRNGFTEKPGGDLFGRCDFGRANPDCVLLLLEIYHQQHFGRECERVAAVKIAEFPFFKK